MLSRMLEARLVFPTDGFSIRCCWWLVTGDTRQLTPDPGPVTTDGDRAAPSHHRDTQLGDTSKHNQCGGVRGFSGLWVTPRKLPRIKCKWLFYALPRVKTAIPRDITASKMEHLFNLQN